MEFRIESGQGHFHQFQLLEVLFLFLYFMFNVVVFQLVLAEGNGVGIPQGCPGGHSEVMCFLGLSNERAFVFQSDFFLFYHCEAVLHIVAWAWKRKLNRQKVTFLGAISENLSDLNIIPRSYLLPIFSEDLAF